MARAFTLIELLVVLLILVIIMAVVIPKGSQMFDVTERYLKNYEKQHNLTFDKAKAFFQAKELKVKYDNHIYTISPKGYIIKDEKINDNN